MSAYVSAFDLFSVGVGPSSSHTVGPLLVRDAWTAWPVGRELLLGGDRPIAFERDDIAFAPRTRLPQHPNALTLTGRDAHGGRRDVLLHRRRRGATKRRCDPRPRSPRGWIASGTR